MTLKTARGCMSWGYHGSRVLKVAFIRKWEVWRSTSGTLCFREGGRLSQSLTEKATRERSIIPQGELDFRQGEELEKDIPENTTETSRGRERLSRLH